MKRSIDIAMAGISIVLVLTWLPLIVKLAQMISYPGPLFFIQKRIGSNGEIFHLYKFRTMAHTNEADLAKMGKATKTSKGDTRVPWFGQLLRKTNLDEYPQFMNVLLGSMSTVGPRPHMVGEDNELANKVLNYRVRRFVKPGITGLAAIKGYRGGTDDLDLMKKRTEFDIWYLENWSLWLDIKIMAITVWQMLTFRIPKAY
ncbi:MAG: exopolysaccharide biosynthesis protein [Candidatus Marinimicrobia bacterium]|nr:exopolysaccharide biosynthesis protein [Candidatus Neomarinimicrobiota bacterium]